MKNRLFSLKSENFQQKKIQVISRPFCPENVLNKFLRVIYDISRPVEAHSSFFDEVMILKLNCFLLKNSDFSSKKVEMHIIFSRQFATPCRRQST